MMVSLIQSNYMGFGSGVVVPGTGISLQNRGAGFSLQAGPSERGRRRQAAVSTRSFPGFVTRDGAPLAAFGVMGGPIQPPGHVQTLVRLLDYGMNPQAVLDAPRWKVNGDDRIDLEASRVAGAARRARSRSATGSKSMPDSYMDFGAGPVHRAQRRTATSPPRTRAATARPRASDAHERRASTVASRLRA